MVNNCQSLVIPFPGKLLCLAREFHSCRPLSLSCVSSIMYIEPSFCSSLLLMNIVLLMLVNVLVICCFYLYLIGVPYNFISMLNISANNHSDHCWFFSDLNIILAAGFLMPFIRLKKFPCIFNALSIMNRCWILVIFLHQFRWLPDSPLLLFSWLELHCFQK